MNKVTTQKYASYRQIASDVGNQIVELNEKCMLIFLSKIFDYICLHEAQAVIFYFLFR